MSEPLTLGRFTLLPRERQLLDDGQPVVLGARAFDVLVALARRSGRLAAKSDLLAEAWPGLVVEENNLAVQIASLRRLMGSEAIVTVPGHGYRLNPRLCTGAAATQQHGNVPAVPKTLFGRTADVEQLSERVRGAALVTVCGSAGIGKTSVAVAVAQALQPAFAYGCWLVPLADIHDPALLASTLARHLGLLLPGHGAPDDELAVMLQSSRRLVILDNCEHLVEDVARLVQRLLYAAPELHLLATSQVPLRIGGEQVYRLLPLDVPAENAADPGAFGAVQLFVERCRAGAAPHDRAELDGVVRICRKLDGIPLALELAAARVPMLGVRGVEQLIDERFRLLVVGDRSAERRHQTLHAALDWSYQLLDRPAQALLRRLSVFEGGFSLLGAALVAGACDDQPIDALVQLGALVERSMIVSEPGQRPRWRLLESMRAFALTELQASGERESVQREHAYATREVCRVAVKDRDTNWLWAEMNNARTALAWALSHPGDEAVAVAIATHTSVLLATAGAVPEALASLQRVLPYVDQSIDPPLAARFWQWLGRLGIEGRLPTSRCLQALERAADMFAALDDARHLHACHRMLAEALIAGGDLVAARRHLAAAERQESALTRPADRMRRLRVAGLLADAEGQPQEALRLAEQALQMAEAHAIARYVAILLADTAWVRLRMGQSDGASDTLRRLLAQLRPTPRDGLTRAYALAGLTAALVSGGRLAEALDGAAETIEALRASGLLPVRCHVFAWMAAACGQVQEAAQLIGAADDSHARAELRPDRLSEHARAAALELLRRQMSDEDIEYWRTKGRAADDLVLAHLALAPTRERQAAHGA